jgi:hypothetical protein
VYEILTSMSNVIDVKIKPAADRSIPDINIQI